jgi:hypothetical protein
VRPAAVLDVQVDLLRWMRSQLGQRYAEYFVDSLRSERNWKVPPEHWRELWDDECHTLDTATTYWASEGVVGLTSNASKTMPDEPLRADDLPSPSGFVWFDRPLYMTDIHQKTVAVRVIVWSPVVASVDESTGTAYTTPSVLLRLYTDNRDPIDEQMRESPVTDLLHPYTLYHFVYWSFGEAADWFLQQGGTNVDGSPYTYDAFESLTIAQNSMHEAAKWLQTFWAFCRQKIVLQHQQRADRPTAKRFLRGSSREDPDVQIVTLRRELEQSVEKSDAEHDVMWTHRWVVDGHWRNQWYPSIGEHRAKYIAPYVKGPDDRPLIIKDKVYKVNR